MILINVFVFHKQNVFERIRMNKTYTGKKESPKLLGFQYLHLFMSMTKVMILSNRVLLPYNNRLIITLVRQVTCT